MSQLQIRLLGSMVIAHGPHSPLRVTKTEQTLLGYLLLGGQVSHPRDVLATILWGDYPESRARSCLSTALCRLRRTLEPPDADRAHYLVTTRDGYIGFNWASNYWLDVAAFEATVASLPARPSGALTTEEATRLEAALALYAGDLLENLYVNWIQAEQERLRLLRLNALSRLMRHYRHHGVHDKSLSYGRLILKHEPLHEETHREMMHLYLESGQRVRALQQYQLCEWVLASELHIAPMEETRLLYEEIMAAGHPPHAPEVAATVSLEAALQELRRAVRAMNDASTQLDRAIHLVEALCQQHANGQS